MFNDGLSFSEMVLIAFMVKNSISGKYNHPLKFICDSISVSKVTIISLLKSLMKKGVIEKVYSKKGEVSIYKILKYI